MDARTPHYLRFARSLAMATTLALPACAGPDDPAAADGQGDETSTTTTGTGAGAGPSASAAPTATTPGPTAWAVPSPVPTANAESDAGAAGDASPGFSSGPLPPLDLPASMA